MGIIHISAFHLPVNGNDDGQGDSGLGGRDGDDKDHEDGAVKTGLAPVFRESQVVDVHGVQHELDPHEDGNRVFTGKNSENTDPEKNGGKIKKMDDRYLVHAGSFRAITTAPTRADKSRIETNSKAKANPF